MRGSIKDVVDTVYVYIMATDNDYYLLIGGYSIVPSTGWQI